MIRTILTNQIIETVSKMCIEANHFLSEDMKQAITEGEEKENSPLGKKILNQLQENL